MNVLLACNGVGFKIRCVIQYIFQDAAFPYSVCPNSSADLLLDMPICNAIFHLLSNNASLPLSSPHPHLL